MKPLFKSISYIFNLDKEQYGYTKDLGFLFRVFILHFIDGLALIFPKTKAGGLDKAKKITKPYLFTTGFGIFLAHTKNAWFVMQENYEPELKEVILENSKKNANEGEKCFINIGTHIGRWTIDVVKNHGYQAICFEPSPETFKYLKINTILSGVDQKITLHNFALGAEEGLVDFEYFPGHDGGSRVLGGGDMNSEFAQILQIPIKKFDDLDIDKDILSKTRLIIMDVEGFEPFVLKGMEESLKHFFNIDIIIEIFDSHEKKQETIEFMKNLGYQAKQIEKDNYLFSKK